MEYRQKWQTLAKANGPQGAPKSLWPNEETLIAVSNAAKRFRAERRAQLAVIMWSATATVRPNGVSALSYLCARLEVVGYCRYLPLQLRTDWADRALPASSVPKSI